MKTVPLIELANMIKQGEAAKREIERRFGINWEDVEKETKELKRGEIIDSTVSAPRTSPFF